MLEKDKICCIRLYFKVVITDDNFNLVKSLNQNVSSDYIGHKADISYDLQIEKGSSINYMAAILLLVNSKERYGELRLAGSLG